MRVLWAEHPDGAGPGVFGEDVEMIRWRAFAEPPPDVEADAIVLFGGATNVVDASRVPWLRDELAWLRELVDAGLPILGVCLGAQLLAHAMGAEVTRAEPPEIGWHDVELTAAGREDPVLSALGERFTALQWHSWACALPEGATALATGVGGTGCLQAFRRDRAWGVQFHPEVDAPTLASWIDGADADPDAVALGYGGETAKAEMERHIPEWNRLGRALFAAFRRAAS